MKNKCRGDNKKKTHTKKRKLQRVIAKGYLFIIRKFVFRLKIEKAVTDF